MLVALLLLTFTAQASAAALTYKVAAGDTLYKIAAANKLSLAQLISYNPQIKNSNMIYPGQVVNLSLSTSTISKSTTTSIKPTTNPPRATTATTTPGVTSAAGENRFTAYLTGYGWPDNTPQGSADISHGILHSKAGGSGTFADPITLAVGHSLASGKDVLDYPAGTKFYIPNLRKYFIVEDTCGDGSAPQNGPCHSGYQGKPWLDLWVGGNAANVAQTLACENTITGVSLVIKNPASNYAVVAGDVASSCKEYGDTVVTQ